MRLLGVAHLSTVGEELADGTEICGRLFQASSVWERVNDFVPPPVHAGGLRYHGDAPMVCGLVKAGVVEARAYKQNETFEAAVRFARCEGIIPAPEPAHAIRAVIEEAEQAKQAGEERVILFNLCGHGHFDLSAYDAYLAGTLEDPEFSEADMEEALARLPEAPAIA